MYLMVCLFYYRIGQGRRESQQCQVGFSKYLLLPKLKPFITLLLSYLISRDVSLIFIYSGILCYSPGEVRTNIQQSEMAVKNLDAVSHTHTINCILYCY